MSFFTALNQHGMTEQIPQLIEVAIRINKKSLDTPYGTYEFHKLQDALYGGWEPAEGNRSEPPAIRPPEPLPERLREGIQRVGRDFQLPGDWMNVGPAAQRKTGLPEGLAERLEWRRFGALHVGLVSRYDLIFFKLYAAADSPGTESVHFQDLVSLEPSDREL